MSLHTILSGLKNELIKIRLHSSQIAIRIYAQYAN